MRFIDQAQILVSLWRGQAAAVDGTVPTGAVRIRTLHQCADRLKAVIDEERANEAQAMQALGEELHRMEQPEFVERLARRVHESWMAEKQRQGYADHAHNGVLWPPSEACCELPIDRHHSGMRPYDRLPDHTKDYDRATVRAVLNALAEEDAE